MNTENALIVQNILKRMIFRKARVVAGEKGLHRRVRWAHVLEISEVKSTIHGGEMILTTGIGLQLNVSSKISYLEKLIQYNAACLCIELGEYFDAVPEDMIQIANEHHFPLIVFENTVRFVDITQDIHSLIINRHYAMLEDLEKISRRLNQLTLSSQVTQKILTLLHESTKGIVVYVSGSGSNRFFPHVSDRQKAEITDMIQKHIREFSQNHDGSMHWTEKDRHLLMQPIRAMGQTFAYVALAAKKGEAGEFESLVLDRVTVALAQDLLRKRYIEEKKLHAEHLWVGDLIHNRLKNEDHIKDFLGLETKENSEYRVCLIEIPNIQLSDQEELESARLHASMMARSVFENEGFRIAMTTNGIQLVIVVISLKSEGFNKENFDRGLRRLQNMKKKEEKSFVMAVGRAYRQFKEAHLSYLEAKFVLRIKSLKEYQECIYFEDIGIFRLLFSIDNEDCLRKFVSDCLGPLIEHDQNRGGNLLLTLKVYLDHNGSKKEAAKELYIVRQTLYHRLDKIRKLLGEDFDHSEKSLSLKVALHAFRLLYPNYL